MLRFKALGLAASLLLTLEEHLPVPLEGSPLRDVTSNLRGADDATRRVADGRHREGHINPLAVLRPPYRLEVVDPFTSPDARDDIVFLRKPLLRNDQRDVPAHRLGLGPAEHALGSPIPRRNDAVERLADDGVVRGVHDRAEPSLHELVLPAAPDVVRDLGGPD